MRDRITPPSLHAIAFKASAIMETNVLANGVTLFYLPMDSAELVKVQFMFVGGQWLQDRPLQAYLAIKLLKEGSRKYSEEVIADLLDYYGASIDARVNMSYAVLTLTCLRRHIDKVLPIVIDMLEAPVYGEDKLNIALAQSRKAYEVGLNTVGEQAKQLFYTNLYGKGHPMAQFPGRYDYDTFTTDDLRRYKERNVNFHNCTIWLTGNVDAESYRVIVSLIEQCDLFAGEVFHGYKAYDITVPISKRFYHEMQESACQSCIRQGGVSLERTHPDYPAMTVLSTILGGYFGSRLMMNIRERKGYTYDIHTSVYQLPHTTALVTTTETPNQFVDEVITEIYAEMQRLVDERVSEDELRLVVNYMTGNLCRGYEGGFSLASRLMRLYCHGLGLADVEHEADVIANITPLELQAVASRHLNLSAMIECVAGSHE